MIGFLLSPFGAGVLACLLVAVVVLIADVVRK